MATPCPPVHTLRQSGLERKNKTPSNQGRNNLLCRSYVFELYVEQVRILEKMDLAGSISAFLHLVFVFNLRYPKVRIYTYRSHTSAHSWPCSPTAPPRLCPVQTLIIFPFCEL